MFVSFDTFTLKIYLFIYFEAELIMNFEFESSSVIM